MERIILRDGRVADFRELRNDREDRALLKELFGHVSADSLYYRFFQVVHEVSDAFIDNLLRNSDENNRSLLCMAGDRVVGIGTYNRMDDERAEVAFLVDDRMQGKGIGTLLLEHLAGIAWRCGFKRFDADILAGNHRMIEVFKSSGFELESVQRSEVIHMTLPLAQTERNRALQDTREKLATAASLVPFFRPRTVAVVGASRDPKGVGHVVLRHILDGGFCGTVYPVNRSAQSVAAVQAYKSVSDIPEPVDLAVIVVPAEETPSVVDDCVQAAVRAVVITSVGFAERDREGTLSQQEITHRLRGGGCRLIGPNCMGLANAATDMRLNASFARQLPPMGNIAIASQSGALGITILEYASRVGLGVSSFASMGNKADVSGNDLLQYWEDDPDTAMILLYLESFGNPRKFSRIARRITRHKPIVAVKSARSALGATVSEARMTALPASDHVVGELFRRTGIIRVDTLHELFDVTALLAVGSLPKGRRIAIVTNTAGGAVMTVDALLKESLQLARPPIDLGFAASADDYRKVVSDLLRDPGVDAVMVIFMPIESCAEKAVSRAIAQALREAEVLARETKEHGGGREHTDIEGRANGGEHSDPAPAVKPVVANYLSTGDDFVSFIDAGERRVPVYPFPEQAMRALAKVTEYAEYCRSPRGHVPDLSNVDCDRARTAVRESLALGSGWMSADAAAEVLDAVGIRVDAGPWQAAAKTPLQAAVAVECDPLFGMVVGVGGCRGDRPDTEKPFTVAESEAIGITPLTDRDCDDMASRVLGADLDALPSFVRGDLEELLQRLSRLAEEVYEITRVILPDIEVSELGCSVRNFAIAAGVR
ncbi:MAG: GNAT family N-acetyltransferase [Bacilli bacterium]